MKAKPVRLYIYRTVIPMRSFEHAAAARNVSESVVVRLEFSDGGASWGQTLARDYVTGETTDGIIRDLEKIIWPVFADKEIDFASVSEKFEKFGKNSLVPLKAPKGRCINAAACAFDLALVARLFEVPGDMSVKQLASLSGRTRMRSEIDVTVSGVLGSSDPEKTACRLALMRFVGLVDFKLKMGLGEQIDRENLHVVHRKIGKALKSGKCTLRVDANGAWEADSVKYRMDELKYYSVCVVEQPMYCTSGELVELAQKCALPLMADESLITEDDAKELLKDTEKVWWNIRLCKNGGFVPSLRLARIAAENDVSFVVGCMVGESGILSAAQRRFLQLSATPRFVEGNYGRLLLSADLTAKPVRFGYAGKLKVLKKLKKSPMGAAVDPVKVFRHSELVKVLES